MVAKKYLSIEASSEVTFVSVSLKSRHSENIGNQNSTSRFWYIYIYIYIYIYREIHKSLRDFRPLRYSSRDGHAEGEHDNRGRDTPNFCPTLQVLDISNLGDVADINPANSKTQRFFIPCPRHVSSRLLPSGETCKYVMTPSTQKNLERYLLMCSFLLCLSWFLRSRFRKFRRDLGITLYIYIYISARACVCVCVSSV